MKTIITVIFIITLFSLKSVSQNVIADSTIIRFFTDMSYKGHPNRYYFIEDSIFFKNEIKAIKKAKFLKSEKDIFNKCSCYSKCLTVKIISNSNRVSENGTVRNLLFETQSPLKKGLYAMQGNFEFHLYYNENNALQRITFENSWGVENELWKFSP